MHNQIEQKNSEFLFRVPLEEFVSEVVRGLREEFERRIIEIRREFRVELLNEERKIMATIDETKTAIARYEAAVEAREAAEQATITGLETHAVPDDVVQGLNDAAAKIEAQNAPVVPPVTPAPVDPVPVDPAPADPAPTPAEPVPAA